MAAHAANFPTGPRLGKIRGELDLALLALLPQHDACVNHTGESAEHRLILAGALTDTIVLVGEAIVKLDVALAAINAHRLAAANGE